MTKLRITRIDDVIKMDGGYTKLVTHHWFGLVRGHNTSVIILLIHSAQSVVCLLDRVIYWTVAWKT